MTNKTETRTLSDQASGRDAVQGRQGDNIRKDQERHEAFDKVNKSWLMKCPTFESVIKEVSAFERTCEDLDKIQLSDLRFVNGKVVVSDVGVYELSDTAVDHLASWSGVPSAYLKLLRRVDRQLFDVNATKGVARAVEEGKDRQTFLRTRTSESGGVMRAMLSDRYAAIDNLPIVEALAEIVPAGRLSHMKFDGDTFRANILIPDVMRVEDDSDYGGGISAINNETGGGSYRQRPFVFRHICCNGNVWDRADGVDFSRVHKGSIDWTKFKHSMIENVQRQIPLVNDLITKTLSLKQVALNVDQIQKSILFVSNREMLSIGATKAWYDSFKVELAQAKTAKGILSAFGVVQGLTRAAQDQTLQVQEFMEVLSGRLIEGNWDRIIAGARTIEDKSVEKVLIAKAAQV